VIARRALVCPIIVFLAVIGQLAVVNRLPLPGVGKPDIVLLVVAAIGIAAGPATGLLAGFAGGLAIDVAPPGGHLAGEYALVYCLVGYGCGRIRDLAQGSSAERSAMASLTVMAVGVAAGEAGKAGLGMMLSDPNVTGPVVKHVLPAAIIYDLLLCPFVLWFVSLTVGTPASERAPEPQFPPSLRLAPAFRLASAGAAPRLRLAGTTPPPVPPPVRTEPRLRLAGGRSSLSPRTNAAFSSAPGSALSGRPTPRLNLASAGRGNQLGGASALRAPARLQGKTPGKGWLRPPRQASRTVRQRRSPGKGWIVAGKPAAAGSWQPKTPGKGWVRPPRPPGMTTWRRRSPGKGWIVAGRPATPVNWQPRSPGKGWARSPKPQAAPKRKSPGRGWIRPAASGALAAPAFRRSSPGKGWLRPAAPPPAPRIKSPGRGWLRSAAPGALAAPSWRPSSPGKGWLRPAKPPPAPRLKSPGRGWLRPARPPRQNWYTKGPSTRWLRRGRRKRLLLGGRR